jgi:hypothetical protein
MVLTLWPWIIIDHHRFQPLANSDLIYEIDHSIFEWLTLEGITYKYTPKSHPIGRHNN